MKHEFWTDKDKNPPHAICNHLGEVVLALCKKCGQAERELDETCRGFKRQRTVYNGMAWNSCRTHKRSSEEFLS